jgi:hypothetical protein
MKQGKYSRFGLALIYFFTKIGYLFIVMFILHIVVSSELKQLFINQTREKCFQNKSLNDVIISQQRHGKHIS